jgi:hypothetical protein
VRNQGLGVRGLGPRSRQLGLLGANKPLESLEIVGEKNQQRSSPMMESQHAALVSLQIVR